MADDLEENNNKHREIVAEINRLKDIGRQWRLTEQQIDASIQKCFDKNEKFLSKLIRIIVKLVRTLILLIAFGLAAYFVISCHNPTKRFFSRYIQGFIYPCMRLLRLGTLPLHSVFSAHWYQDDCLLQNPFYQGNPVDCWPCQNVRFVADFSEVHNFSETFYNYGIPFTTRDPKVSAVSFERLKDLYLFNSESLEKGTARFYSNYPDVSSPRSLFENSHELANSFPQFHSEWKFDKVVATQLVRKLFPRPGFIPKETEVALQKFLFIDSSESETYSLPVTDFANVWFAQADGHRLMILEPTHQCRKLCSTLSVVLQPREILFYNWQFWRPVSLPVNMSKGLTIGFMGSFY